MLDTLVNAVPHYFFSIPPRGCERTRLKDAKDVAKAGFMTGVKVSQ